MAKRFFHTLQQHCTQHVRRYYPKNKTTHFHCNASQTHNRSFSSSSSCSNNSKKLGFVGWYLRKLETYPVITKCITSSLIFTAADLTSQVIVITFSLYSCIYGYIVIIYNLIFVTLILLIEIVFGV